MTRPTIRGRRLLAGVAGCVLVLSGCNGGSAGTGEGPTPDSSATTEPSSGEAAAQGMVTVETKVGTVSRPEEWKPGPTPAGQDASFLIEDDAGEVVGQMDVIVNTVTPGTAADAVAASIQGARMTHLPSLRHDRREFVEVPGAASAFLTESHYTTADTGLPARSLEVVAVREDGTFLLTRISALEDAYDAALAQRILDTMRLTGGAST